MKHFRRTAAVLLVLALMLAICLPSSAAQKTENISYFIPYTQTIDASVVTGGTVVLQFRQVERAPKSTDLFVIGFCRNTAESLVNGAQPNVLEERSYRLDQFDDGSIGVAWTADERYPVGSGYCCIYGLVSAEGEPYGASYTFDVHVTSVPIRADGMECTIYREEMEPFKATSFDMGVGEQTVLIPNLVPYYASNTRQWTAVSSKPAVADIYQTNGCFVVSGYAAGQTQIRFTGDGCSMTVYVSVGWIESFRLKAGSPTLCIGQSDTVAVSAETGGADAYFDWKSDNPAVATVENGVVTARSLGKATITASAFGKSQSLVYTVQPHTLPADTPVTTRTATMPVRAVGHCSNCGQDNCVNIYENAVFIDTQPESWYASYVDEIYEKEIMTGVSADHFSPEGTPTRAQLVTILYRMAGSPDAAYSGVFLDVPDNRWYTDPIEWAAANELVNGVGGGRFDPDERITREQIATVLYHFAGKPESTGDLSRYPDAASVSEYAQQPMLWATQAGLVTGIAGGGATILSPRSYATRAQIAAIISRYLAMTK